MAGQQLRKPKIRRYIERPPDIHIIASPLRHGENEQTGIEHGTAHETLHKTIEQIDAAGLL